MTDDGRMSEGRCQMTAGGSIGNRRVEAGEGRAMPSGI
jgi:hypothetical protein